MRRVGGAISQDDAQAIIDKLASLPPSFGEVTEALKQSLELLADAARSINQLPKHMLQDLSWPARALDSLVVWSKGAPANASCNALLLLKFAMKQRSVDGRYMRMALQSVVDSTALVDGIITESSLADGHTSSENMSRLLNGSLLLVRSIELIEFMAERDDVPAVEAKGATLHVFSMLTTTSKWRQSSSDKGTPSQQQVQKFVSKLEVHLCKYISLLMEVWKNEKEAGASSLNLDTAFVSTLLASLAAIQNIVMTSDIVHDAFLGAFGLVIEVIGQRDRGDNDAKIESELAKVLDACQQWMKGRAEVVQEGLSGVVALVEVRRLESVLSLVEYVFNPGELTGPALHASQSPEYKYARCGGSGVGPVDTAVQTIVEAQKALRSLSKFGGTPKQGEDSSAASMTAEERAELRKMCSDCRRTSIEAAVAALDSRAFLAQSGASWVHEHYQDPEGEFWMLSLRHLSSPLLFPSAYRAYLTFEAGGPASTGAAEESEGMEILMFEARRAVRNVQGYSINAATDVLEAVDALLDLGCRDLLLSNAEDDEDDEDDEEDIISLLLTAYDARPRGCSQESLWRHHERTLYCLGKAFTLLLAPARAPSLLDMSTVFRALSEHRGTAKKERSEQAPSPVSRALQRLTRDTIALFSAYNSQMGGHGEAKKGGVHPKSHFGASLSDAEALLALQQACSSALMTALNVAFSLPLSPSEVSQVAGAQAASSGTTAGSGDTTARTGLPTGTTADTPGLGDGLMQLMRLLHTASSAASDSVFEDEHRLRLMLPDLTAKVTIAAHACARQLDGGGVLGTRGAEAVRMGVDIICRHACLHRLQSQSQEAQHASAAAPAPAAGGGADMIYPFGREALLYLGDWLHSLTVPSPDKGHLRSLYSALPVDAPTPIPSPGGGDKSRSLATEVHSLIDKMMLTV